MNYAVVLKSLGILLIFEAFAMLPSLIVAALYGGNDLSVFVYTILLTFIVGSTGLLLKPKSKAIHSRDGFAIVAFGWLLITFFGSLPFIFSGVIPSFVDAFFETSSGLTTGASIMTNVEGLPMGVMFWRSFNHWIGGMGVLALTLAILSQVSAGAINVFKAETSGPRPGKIVPKVGQSAKILYFIYLSITGVLVILLYLAGMPLYDAFIHTFGTVGTGGFSVKNASIGAYNNVAVEIIITFFMMLGGGNFTLYYIALKGGVKKLFKDAEFIHYVGILSAATILITINLNGSVFNSIWTSLRYAVFQVVSITTTTGFTSTDYDKWPTFSKAILLVLMFYGGCAGSTAGGIKHVRILLLFKIIKRNLLKIMHPRAVLSVIYGEKAVDEETLSEVLGYFFMYMLVFVLAFIIVSLDGKDLITTFSAVASTLSNVGPGFAGVGPSLNYSGLSDLSKIVLSLCMIMGRIEIYPILLLLFPAYWKKGSM